ncbi:MAG: hypothetical protein NZZ41_08135, partial [Candidatus Dojkabacteria bacterium]|nr:hypothetical protein [Candidatus Dojkabacteria bacterium]
SMSNTNTNTNEEEFKKEIVSSEQTKTKPKSIKELISQIYEEYKILYSLITESHYIKIEDVIKTREQLNKVIYEIRKTQNFLIKIKMKSDIS